MGQPIRFLYTNGNLTTVRWPVRPQPQSQPEQVDLARLSYDLTGMVSTVDFHNGYSWFGETDETSVEPRYKEVGSQVTGGARLWQPGMMRYDAQGNLIQWGENRSYSYDPVSRLVSASVLQGTVDYSYDVFGNLLKIHRLGDHTGNTPECTAVLPTGAPAGSLCIDPASNRITQEGFAYDPAGRMTELEGMDLQWDPLGSLVHTGGSIGVDRSYLYDHANERVATLDYASGTRRDTWTLRDAGHQVARVLEVTPEHGWRWVKDYARGSGRLLAVRDAKRNATYAFVDHLGSPGQFIDQLGSANSFQVRQLLPFGWPAEQDPVSEEAMTFTGHERDRNYCPDGDGAACASPTRDDLDYMHARYYSPLMGRFLSPDPGTDWNPAEPQSWNLFAYVRNNPVNSVDPTGLYECTATEEDCDRFESSRQANLKSKSADLRATAEAYGNPGDANGVTVTFGSVKEGSAANVLQSITYDDSTGLFSYSATVTIGPDLDDPELRSSVGHEGQHLVDGQAFFATVGSNGQSSDPALNVTHAETERRAYAISHRIRVAENRPEKWMGVKGPVTLGKHLVEGKLLKRIEDIIKGPLYDGKRDHELFPGFE